MHVIGRTLLRPLMNQRGEVGDAEAPVDTGVEFSDEERRLLGEAVEEPEEKTEEEPAAAEEEEKEDPVVEEEENVVPQSRFNEVYGKHKEASEKLELLKSDPAEYYRRYPQEKPPEQKKPSSKASAVRSQVISDGGEYDGMTIADVFDIDPIAGYEYLADAKAAEAKAAAAEEAERLRLISEIETERKELSEIVGNELFSKASGWSIKEKAEVDKIITQTEKFMIDTGRATYRFSDAYYLMTSSDRETKARSMGAEKVIRSITDPGTRTIASKGEAGPVTGFEHLESMSPDQLEETISKMSDSEYLKFKANAPRSLKNKYPELDWG